MNLFGRRKRRYEIEANRFGPFNVVKVIHDGEKALVYQAQHRTTRQVVAIKVYKRGFNKAALNIQRKYAIPSEGEVGLAITKAHEGKRSPIVKVFDHGREFGKANGNQYIVMEYVEGVNLKHMVSCRDTLLSEHRDALLRRIARGLAALHQLALIHRDFCTDNVIVTNGIKTKIIDLGFTVKPGIAFEERSGTPSYMAPEQIRGQVLTEQTDIYGFGVVMYELLTYRLPFTSKITGDSPRKLVARHKEIMDKHLKEFPVPPRQVDPEIPKLLEAITMCCLEKKPEERFQDARELMGALKRAC